MAFKTKQECFGMSSLTGLKLVSTSDGASAQNVEARGEDGFTVAREVYGEKLAPSAEYEVVADVPIGGIEIGDVNQLDGKGIVKSTIRVTTSAGGAPKVSVSGVDVGSSSSTGKCKVKIPTGIVIKALHHAQMFDQFTISGTGAHLTDCSLEATVQVSEATKDGETIAFDVVDGRMTISGTIQVSDASYGKPTIETNGEWDITSPLAETNPDSNFPTYAFTMVRSLAAEVAAA